MARYQREFAAGARWGVPAQHREVYERFLLGTFDSDFDMLTREHGFGKLRTESGKLGPIGFLPSSPP
jgi:hypothetical protein